MIATDPAAQHAKGSALQSTQRYIAATYGEGVLRRILERLPAADRARLERSEPTEEVGYPLLLQLWRAADAELGAEHPEWIEQSGAYAIEAFGVRLYGGILRKASPTEFLTQRVSLFQLYYGPGNMEVVEEESGRAVLRLVGFDPGAALFCRRQSGGLLRSVEIAGGRDAVVRHCRCSLDGDAFCEWELGWR